jgi:hypothetical protein
MTLGTLEQKMNQPAIKHPVTESSSPIMAIVSLSCISFAVNFVFAHLAKVTVRKQKNLIKQQGENHGGQRSGHNVLQRGAV